MKKTAFLTVIFAWMISSQLFGSDTICVTNQTIRVKSNSSATVYFSFRQGDVVLFSLKEKKEKKITLLSIQEDGQRIVYQSQNIQKPLNGLFFVPTTKVYHFKFINDALSSRSIEFVISRIPSSNAYASFNTSPLWIDKIDTLYDVRKNDQIVGFDSIWKTIPVLIKDTCIKSEEISLDQTIRLESSISLRKKNRAVIEINMDKAFSSELMEIKPVAWAYWIGVGEEAQDSWNQTAKNAAKLTGSILSKFVNPLLGFAVGIIPEFIVPSSGKNISYWFVNDTSQVNNFLNKKDFESIEHGKAIVAYGKKNNPNNRKLYLCILNESAISPAEVNVKFAIQYEECKKNIRFEQNLQLKPIYKRAKANKPMYKIYKIPIVNQ